jgi:hypothetical protein
MTKMKLLSILSFLFIILSCNKREENAMKLGGTWELQETVVTNYNNNEAQADSLVDQQGEIIFEVTGDLDNPVRHNLDYGPCLQMCYWDFPKKSTDQLFFYYHDGNTSTIYSSSCGVQRLSKNHLEIISVNYDNDLNIHQKTIWKFRRSKL